MNMNKNVKGENLTDFAQLVVFLYFVTYMCKRRIQSN